MSHTSPIPNENPRILATSRSSGWRERVVEALASAPLEVVAFESGREVLEDLATAVPRAAAVLTDAVTRDMTGVALCRRIREKPDWREVCVLIVSHWASEMDRVVGFENGADDYVADPFFPRELLSRVQALLRRGRQRPEGLAGDALSWGDLAIDLRRGRVEVDGHRVPLTHREYDVLRVLVLESGRVVTRADLLAQLDGESEEKSPRVVDTHVKAIRAKLGVARDHIETIRGVGYRFDPRDA